MESRFSLRNESFGPPEGVPDWFSDHCDYTKCQFSVTLFLRWMCTSVYGTRIADKDCRIVPYSNRGLGYNNISRQWFH